MPVVGLIKKETLEHTQLFSQTKGKSRKRPLTCRVRGYTPILRSFLFLQSIAIRFVAQRILTGHIKIMR